MARSDELGEHISTLTICSNYYKTEADLLSYTNPNDPKILEDREKASQLDAKKKELTPLFWEARAVEGKPVGINEENRRETSR